MSTAKKKKPKWRVKKLSTALKQALVDLRWVERNKRRFEVNMCDWYVPAEPGYSERCAVCLAGAHMAKTVDGPRPLGPGDFDRETADMYRAIDCLRTGDVSSALHHIGKSPREDLDRFVVDYEDNPKLWWKQMRQLVRALEKARL